MYENIINNRDKETTINVRSIKKVLSETLWTIYQEYIYLEIIKGWAIKTLVTEQWRWMNKQLRGDQS